MKTPSFKKTRWTVAAARAALDATKLACAAGIPIPGASNAFFNQRPLSPAQVKKYVDAYATGTWHSETAEMVKLALWNGERVILDGQHRLAAVVDHGAPVDIWTAFDVPMSAFPFLDQGATRSIADILASLSWREPQLFGTIGRLMYREETGGDPRQVNDDSRCTEAVIADYLGPQQLDLYEMRDAFTNDTVKAVKAGVGAHRPGLLYSLMRAAQVDRKMAEKVAAYLGDTRAVAPPNPVWPVFAELMGNPKTGLVAQAKQVSTVSHHAMSNASLCNIIVTAFPVAWNIARSGARKPTLKALTLRVQNAALPGTFEAIE